MPHPCPRPGWMELLVRWEVSLLIGLGQNQHHQQSRTVYTHKHQPLALHNKTFPTIIPLSGNVQSWLLPVLSLSSSMSFYILLCPHPTAGRKPGGVSGSQPMSSHNTGIVYKNIVLI